MKNKENKRFFTTSEVAKLYGISRVAIFKKIKKGKIKAKKIGRNYVIEVKDLNIDGNLSTKAKNDIDKAVKKAVKEYGDVFRKLGKE